MQKGSIITIGTFDGVHKGHRKIFKKIGERSRETGLQPIALVFTHSPKHVLAPLHEPAQLTVWHEKKQKIQSAGIHRIIPLTFTRTLAHTDPEQFFKRLIERYRVRDMVVGYNFSFGKHRQAHIARLKELGKKYCVYIEVIPPLNHKGAPISSSSIRTMIQHGRLSEASRMLGYHYDITGKIVRGLHWARTRGFPTANINVQPKKLLPRGVFAVNFEVNGRRYNGVANIGYRPTLHPVKRMLVEVYVIGKRINLYGKTVRAILLKKIRDEHEFDNKTALVDRIKLDIETAKKYFLQTQ